LNQLSPLLYLGGLFSTAGVAPEGSGDGKLTQLVPHHVLGDKDGHVPAAIMDADVKPHHLGQNGARARPGFYNHFLARAVGFIYFGQQLGIYGWPFFN
jgi:hypothetical protein